VQSPRLARLLSDPSPRAVDRLCAEVADRGGPLLEPHDDQVLATFLWRGETGSVRAWWGVDVPMARLPGTDLWTGSELMPADLRTTYCFEHDGAENGPRDPSGTGEAHIDLLNRHRLHFPADPADPGDVDTWLSVLSLPKAPDEPWLHPPAEPGTITETTLPAQALGGARRVAVYRPYGVATAGLPVLVVFDGFLARQVLCVPTLLDNLIAAGRVPPLVALFVSNFDATREQDLSPDGGLSDFVGGELLPWARSTLGAGLAPGPNIVAGVSRGGLAAAFLGLTRPADFGAVIAQSGSFWWPEPAEGEPGRLIREVARHPRGDVRFYLDVGVRETMPGPGGAPDQLTVNRAMRDALRSRGYPVDYAEYTGSHDYLNWRRTFADGLLAVAGRR
jgi:enterochelin esterase-like enzyme